MRATLVSHGVRSTAPAFYQLMARLERDDLVEGRYEQVTAGDQSVTERRYTLRPAGARLWTDARDFYASVADGAARPRWSDAESRLARLLSRLLPPRTRRDLFEPSAADLRGDYARAGRGSAAVMPLTGSVWSVAFDRADRPVPAGARAPDVGWQAATGGYFTALGIPLLEGRLFSREIDRPGSPGVVIISEAIRERFFDGGPAVGRRVLLGDGEAEIVGVVGSIRRGALTDEPWADMYFSQEQSPGTAMTLFIRTAGEPASLVPAVRSALQAVDPAALVRRIQTLDDVARESVQVTRLALWLLGMFAATALALAAVGIYGVMSYAIRQRMRELGTRVALGATPGSILRLVLGNGAKIAALGTGIGLLASFVAGRALQSLLFSTAPSDPAVLAGAAALLGVTAMLACYIPARRASRVDPVQTLSSRRASPASAP